MRGVFLLLLVCTACSRKTAPVAVVDAGPPPPVVVEKKPVPPSLPDAGYRLAWISEASGQPQVVVDGAPVTTGPAAHYLAAASAVRLLATRSTEGVEQLVSVSFDGAVVPLSAPSPRARSVTEAGGVVLFESGATGLSSLERVDGGALVDHPAGSFEPSLAPDGTWFAFVSSRDGDAEIYRAAIDGGQLQRLTAFHLDDVAPKVSPDGRWIAFVSNREGQDRLFLVRPDGRHQRRLHADDSQDTRFDAGEFEAAEADAVWTPDSRELIFSARGPRGHWQLYLAEVATARRTQLTDGAWDDQLPAVSPDGKWIGFVSSRDGDPEVYVMPRGGAPTRVTRSPGADWKPLWIPATQAGGTGPR